MSNPLPRNSGITDEKIAVLGAGIMGSSIAAACALSGVSVTTLSRDAEQARVRTAGILDRAKQWQLAEQETIDRARERLQCIDSLAEFPPDITLVLESLPESLTLKIDVLRAVLGVVGRDVLVATNTSSLSVAEIGRAIDLEPGTVGLHFMNPALLMPVVELVPTKQAAPVAVERCHQLATRLGKRVIHVRGDSPGFVWNRLQIVLLRESVQLVRDGIASIEDVDAAVGLGLARRWQYTGPLMTARLGGPETFRVVARNVLPICSQWDDLDNLEDYLPATDAAVAAVAAREDGLAELLRASRADARSH